MIINFKDIEFDAYGNIEEPTLSLKYMDGRMCSSIGTYMNFLTIFRYNDVSEISFEVPAYNNGEKIPYYDDILGFKLVEFLPFGDFIIASVKKDGDGIKETKTVKAYSLEYAFNFKTANIPKGTYNFYNPVDNKDTIMNILIEFMPDWKIGSVDRELIGRWRTFDNIDTNLYSFMMNTLQETYNCLFLFDTKEKKINVISASKDVKILPIHLSFENLINSLSITELTDEVVTVLAGYGADNMSIAYVNPNGTDKIYNLDWLIRTGNMSDELADAWIEYKNNTEFYQQVYSNLNTMHMEKLLAHQLAESDLSIIQIKIDALEAAIIAGKTDNTVEGWEENIAKLEEEKAALEVQKADQQALVDKYLNDKIRVEAQIDEILEVCKLSSFFSEEQLKILSMYFKEDSIVESSFVIPQFNSAFNVDNSTALTDRNEAIVKITGSVIEDSSLAEVFEVDENGDYVAFDEEHNLNLVEDDKYGQIDLSDGVAEAVAEQLNQNKNKVAYNLRGGSFDYYQKTFTSVNGKEEEEGELRVKGSIVNVSFQYNVNNLSTYEDESSPDITKEGYFLVSIALRDATYNDTSYPTMNITMQGMIKGGMPQVNDNFLGFRIENGTFYNTAGVTEYQRQSVYQELYDYVEDTLKKVSEPSYQFDIDAANYIFDISFKEFTKRTELGSCISIDIEKEVDIENILYPILIELHLDYENPENFKIVFSDKYKSSDPEFLLADLIGASVTSSKTLDLNKASYDSYINSGAGSAIDSFANDAYDIARHSIINSTNQGVEWNSKGLFLRRRISQDEYEPEQIAMINNMIAFTDDTWESVKLAIGKFKDTNVGDTWGIAAPNITGTIFAGKNLVIENTVLNEDGTKVVKQFKVDETGAWLNNSALYFSQEPIPATGYSGGKMFIDPKWGFAAGNINLFKGEGTNISPSFIDEDGNIIFDELEHSRVPLNTSFYFDINHDKAYFAGDIYAENGYFAGEIDASKIIAGTLILDGKYIIDGTIDAGDKLTGSVNADQIYENVIAAINKYIQFSEDKGKPITTIGSAVIGDLSADKITSGDIDTERLQANVIEAINASIGKIDSDKIDVDTIVGKNILIIGENGKLAINPEYGIVAGNAQLFDVDDEGNITNETFISNGELVFDDDSPAPKNTAFYFDINTGKAYFSGSLSASDITTGKLSSDYLYVKDGFITNAMIENLNAEKINAGDIAADRLSANVISAINASTQKIDGERLLFKNGYIQNAWIGDLSADKLTSGTIYTNRVTVKSDDGGFLINGNVTQWTDKTGKVRLQAGQDASGNFNFAIFGEDGTTAYFDEGGIHAEGIRDNILVDDMMKPITDGYAGIQGDKLNISSVITTINSDGTTNINSGKIWFQGNKQPVYVAELDDEGNIIQEPVVETYYDYQRDENGDIQYDSSGQPLLTEHTQNATDEDGNIIYQNKYVQEVGEDGQPLYETVVDESGNPVYSPKLDKNGGYIYDQSGKIVYNDEPDKRPVYKQETDLEGNPVFSQEQMELNVYLNNLTTDFEGNIEEMTSSLKYNSKLLSSTISSFTQFQNDTNQSLIDLSTTIQQTASELRFEFNEMISENGADFSKINRFMSFTAEGIEFGDKEPENPNAKIPKIKLGIFALPEEEGLPAEDIPGRLIFYSDDTAPVAWLDENQLVVTEANIREKLYLGKFAFIPRVSGNLSFTKVGD